MIPETPAFARLREIGDRLDAGALLRVYNAGIVMPDDPAVVSSIQGEETTDDRRETSPRSATGSWQGATGGQGSAGRQGTTGQAAPFIGANFSSRYEAELDGINKAYPGARVWHQEQGFWLLTESRLTADFPQRAVFLTGVSFALNATRGWAFWRSGLGELTWIGPRHTNSPDGSVCAFQLLDNTWRFGDPLVELLDLYTVWALRHAYLRHFGRWPGEQSVPLGYERVMELHEDEHCGCGQSGKRYGECCREKDFAGNRIADAVKFVLAFGSRRPPTAVSRFVYDQTNPPRIGDLIGAKREITSGLPSIPT